MSSIVHRVAVLGLARIAQQALGFLSPIIMVRLLTVEQYGEYRDFLLYGTILVMIAQFSVSSSLAYFIPRQPQREQLYFTQATLFVFAVSLVTVVLVLIAGQFFPSEIARSYKTAIIFYVLFAANLDLWDVFWITKKQAEKVLVYSLARFGLRMLVVVMTAYVSRSVNTLIWALIGFELCRFVVMGGYAVSQKLITNAIDRSELAAQFAFFGPIGSFQMVFTVNTYLGQFFVSAAMGPQVLAIYSIGAFLYPIIRIIRGSIGQVIMPEIVGQRNTPVKEALGLWQRATLVYCSAMMPMAILLFYYSPEIVEFLFTSAYADAVPVFRVFVLLLIRECFDMALPLRVVNRTNAFFIGGLLMLFVNLLLMVGLFDLIGVLAPAVAILTSRVILGFYLGSRVLKYCDFKLREMLPWNDILKIAGLSLIAFPVMIAGEFLDMNSILRAVLVGGIYVTIYICLLAQMRVPEISDFMLRTWGRISGRKYQQ